MSDAENRCSWCINSDLERDYHDREWGTPIHSDRKQFEYLMLEAMQCGLSWKLMLEKREIFRSCFDDFDFIKVAKYNEEDIERIMNTPGMIKSRRKVLAIINNAKHFIEIRKEWGSFDDFIWSFTCGKTIVYKDRDEKNLIARNKLSDEISKALKKRGFKYIGSITLYAHLEACGIINDHSERCFKFKELIKESDVEYRNIGEDN